MAKPTSVLGEFRKWGLDREDLPVLLLIPMAEVAPDTFTLTEAARAFLYSRFVYVKPDPALTAKAIGLLAMWLDEMEEADADRVRHLIVEMCFEVAERSGGFLGLFGRIGADEARVLRNLFARLH